jgi:UDP-N-acetylmuramate--alanine ligase
MRHLHLIGIGGTGMSSIARVLVEKGYTVSGSDRTLSSMARDLQALGVQVAVGHAAENIQGADTVVRSSAIPDDNVEVLAALKAGIPVLKRADFLPVLMKGQSGVAIAGSHGKTTTTAMLTWALYSLGYDPTFLLGGVSLNLGLNAHAGKGEYFVLEADEYDRMFLGLSPKVEVITNVEYDHPDCFPTPLAYRIAFEQFVTRLNPGGLLITNYDDHGSSHLKDFLLTDARSASCGLRPGADYQAANIRSNTIGGSTFEVLLVGSDGQPQVLTVVSLQLPGEHNVRNALQVVAALHQMGVPVQQAAQSLSEFKGTGRRFELVGEANGISIINDYAHHPTKIRATLAAARSRYPGRRLVAVWQPHTFSRTQTLEGQFISSLAKADRLFVTEIYAAREQPTGYSARNLVEKMKSDRVTFTDTLAGTTARVLQELLPGDVLVVLSAGDADQICDDVLRQLKERES